MATETMPENGAGSTVGETQPAKKRRPKIDYTQMEWRNVPKKKRHHLLPKFAGVDGNSKLQLAKPFTKKARRIIDNKTRKLTERRNELDIELVEEVEKEHVDVDDWLPREKLLRRQVQLEKREKRHIKSRTKALKERERLYNWDPSTERAHDLDLIRTLLWQFERHLGPYKDYHKDIGRKNKDDEDETSSAGSDTSGDDDTGLGGPSDDDETDSESGKAQVSVHAVVEKEGAPSSRNTKKRKETEGDHSQPSAEKRRKESRSTSQENGGKEPSEDVSYSPIIDERAGGVTKKVKASKEKKEKKGREKDKTRSKSRGG